jgi:hypothetical protein
MSGATRAVRAFTNARAQSAPRQPARTTPVPSAAAGARTQTDRRDAVEFVADDTMRNVVAGFTAMPRADDPSSIEAGIRFADGVAAVWERGLIRQTISFHAGDVFRIEIAGGVAMYSRNGALFHAGTSMPAEPLTFSVLPSKHR